MKKLYLTIICLLTLSCAIVDAQYRINKHKYDYHRYIYQPGDPYNPGSATFASLVVPGLGQIISGETGRGLGFMARCGLSLGCSFAGLMVVSNSDERDPDFFQKQRLGATLYLAGIGSALINWIWGIGDAGKVAKVNNMALRDRKNKSGTLSIRPYLYFPSHPVNKNILIGFSLNVNFQPDRPVR
jgi:TM2 domain-containing membrane protein YozV